MYLEKLKQFKTRGMKSGVEQKNQIRFKENRGSNLKELSTIYLDLLKFSPIIKENNLFNSYFLDTSNRISVLLNLDLQ